MKRKRECEGGATRVVHAPKRALVVVVVVVIVLLLLLLLLL